MKRAAPNVPLVAVKKVAYSLYFLPAFLTALSIATAVVLLYVDKNFASSYPFTQLWWNDMDGAREFLSTSAATTVSVASVAFSVVVVALTLASNQFCPRVLRRFIEDRTNRLVFGTLIGNFAYALVGLSVLGEETRPPGLTLTGCFLFDLASTALFIYFIHHVASSLQVDSIVTEIRQATVRQIELLRQSEKQCLGPADTVPSKRDGMCPAGQTGFVQGLRIEKLLELSSQFRTPFRLCCAMGDFVTPQRPCLERFSPQPDPRAMREIAECFEVDYSRLLEHDISYGIREIVDIALKAISPAVNDPTTAVMCIHNLAAIFEALATGGWPRTSVKDEKGGEVVLPNNSPFDYLSLATDQLLHYAQNAPRVMQSLAEFLDLMKSFDLGLEWQKTVDSKETLLLEAVDAGWESPLWRERMGMNRRTNKNSDSKKECPEYASNV